MSWILVVLVVFSFCFNFGKKINSSFPPKLYLFKFVLVKYELVQVALIRITNLCPTSVPVLSCLCMSFFCISYKTKKENLNSETKILPQEISRWKKCQWWIEGPAKNLVMFPLPAVSLEVWKMKKKLYYLYYKKLDFTNIWSRTVHTAAGWSQGGVSKGGWSAHTSYKGWFSTVRFYCKSSCHG